MVLDTYTTIEAAQAARREMIEAQRTWDRMTLGYTPEPPPERVYRIALIDGGYALVWDEPSLVLERMGAAA